VAVRAQVLVEEQEFGNIAQGSRSQNASFLSAKLRSGLTNSTSEKLVKQIARYQLVLARSGMHGEARPS
jgi:hypothetical protein